MRTVIIRLGLSVAVVGLLTSGCGGIFAMATKGITGSSSTRAYGTVEHGSAGTSGPPSSYAIANAQNQTQKSGLTQLITRTVLSFSENIYESAMYFFSRLDKNDPSTRAEMEEIVKPGLDLAKSKYGIAFGEEKLTHDTNARKIFLHVKSDWKRVSETNPVIQKLGLQGRGSDLKMQVTLKDSFIRFIDRGANKVYLHMTLVVEVQAFDKGKHQWADLVPEQSNADMLSKELASDLTMLYRKVIQSRYRLTVKADPDNEQ